MNKTRSALAATRLGLRLGIGGTTATRMLAIAAAATAALASIMMLAVLAAVHVHSAETHRTVARSPYTATGGPLLYEAALQADQWDGRPLTRVLLASVGSTVPLPPGLTFIPGPRQAVVSPKLLALMKTNADIRQRFAGRTVSAIGAAGLVTPDELIAYEGEPVATMRQLRALTVTGFGNGATVASAPHGLNLSAILLFFAFIVAPFGGVCAIVTRLSAAARERRLIALRIIGLTPGQVRTVATVESACAVLAGCLVGIGLFWLVRPIASGASFGGTHHFETDMTVAPWLVVGLAAILTIIGIASGWSAAGRVGTVPVAVRPVASARAVRKISLLPLGAAVGAVIASMVLAKTRALSGPSMVKFIDFAAVLTIVALAVATPALAQVVANWSLRRRLPVSGVLAARRLSNDPGTATRVAAIFAAAAFAIGFALTLASQFTLNTSAARAELTQGGRTIANVSSSFLPLDTAALARADTRATVLPQIQVEGPHHFQTRALVGDCHQYARLTNVRTCPSDPVMLMTSPSAAPVAPGTVLRLVGSDSASSVLRWPAAKTHVDAPDDAGLDGVLWVPNSIKVVEGSTVRPTGATVIVAPTSAARERLRAAVAATAPSALVQFPGEGIVQSASNYHRYGDTIVIAAGMASALGLVALLATAFDTIRQRGRSLQALYVIGAPTKPLRRSSGIEIGAPLIAACFFALAAAAGIGSAYLVTNRVGFPSGSFGVLVCAFAGVCLLLLIFMTEITGHAARRITSMRTE